MEKEFNLSEKEKVIETHEDSEKSIMFTIQNHVYYKNDVKEFIRVLEENKVCSVCKDNPCNCREKDWVVGLETIKEFAGDELI